MQFRLPAKNDVCVKEEQLPISGNKCTVSKTLPVCPVDIPIMQLACFPLINPQREASLSVTTQWNALSA